MRIARHWASAAAAILVLVAFNAQGEQNAIEDANVLYASASFDNALAALERLDGPVGREPDVLQYKALCLLALGRPEEAQSVVDALVTARPTFAPASRDDISPRLIALFTETRRRLLPDIAKRMLADAREQFRVKDQIAAKKQFEQVLVLATDPVWSDQAGAADLRTLASGFLDLMNTSTPVRPASSPIIEPLSSAAAPTTPRSEHTGLLPPVPLVQTMPKWRPTDTVTAQRRYRGAVRVRIGVDGHVTSATVEVPSNADYDKLVLEAARSWTYKPATRNGEAVEVDKLVTFSLSAN